MSGRELSIDVNAEGVEDAAGEFEDVSGAAAGGDGVDVGGGGGGGKGGRFGKILTRLLGLLAFLGPILDVLGAVSQVLTAFVAPVAVLLMRLLTPALRLLIRALPLWFAFNEKIGQLIGSFQGWVLSAAQTAVNGGISALIAELPGFDPMGLAERFGRFLTSTGQDIVLGIATRVNRQLGRLPSDIGSAIASKIPSFGGLGGGGGNGGGGFVDQLLSRFDGDDGDGGGDSGGSVVNIGGGLGAFVDEVTRNNSFDFP